MRKKYPLKFKLPSGYEVRFGYRSFANNCDLAGGLTDVSIMVMGYVFKGKRKIGACPGVITVQEVKKPGIIRELFINHVQSLQDLAEHILGSPEFFLEDFLKDNPKYAYEYTINLLGATL